MSDERLFDVVIDRERRVLTIQGVRYDFELFDRLAFGKTGQRFEVGERDEGVVTLHQI